MQFVGLDVETWGKDDCYALQSWRLPLGEARITSFAAVNENGKIIARGLNPTKEEIQACLIKLAEDKTNVIVGSNTVFDVSWLLALGLDHEVWNLNWADFKFYWRCLENVPDKIKSWGLKAAVKEFLPKLDGYADGIDFNEETEKLLIYNTIDAGATAMIARLHYDKLDNRNRILAQVMNRNIPHFAAAWLEGITIDKAKLAEWRAWAESEIAEAVPVTMLTEKILRSPMQLKRALTEMGFNVDSTDKETLSQIEDVRVKAIAKYKIGAGNISRYIAPIEDCITYTGTGRAHPQSNIWNTYTGRVGYTSLQKKKYQVGFALHQLPRTSPKQYPCRSAIVAPPGYLLAEYDFSNQESRILADLTEDAVLLQTFNEGLDYHALMGAKIAGLDYQTLLDRIANGDKEAKQNRLLGKVANLALSYRAGWKRFQEYARTNHELVIEDRLAQKIHRTYQQTYPGIKSYWERAVATAKSKGYAETIAGRRCYLTEWTGKGAYMSAQTAINFPVQGLGADIKYLAVAAIEKELKLLKARYAFDLHDALFIYIPENDSAHVTAKLIKDSLNHLPYKEVYGWTPKVPMIVDGKIGRSWGDMEEI